MTLPRFRLWCNVVTGTLLVAAVVLWMWWIHTPELTDLGQGRYLYTKCLDTADGVTVCVVSKCSSSNICVDALIDHPEILIIPNGNNH